MHTCKRFCSVIEDVCMLKVLGAEFMPVSLTKGLGYSSRLRHYSALLPVEGGARGLTEGLGPLEFLPCSQLSSLLQIVHAHCTCIL